MARPKCARFVRDFPNSTFFKPRGVPLCSLQEVVLTFDEFEALRLADLEGLYQEEAAAKMKVSRATFGRILTSAHGKVADGLINGRAIRIDGGNVKMVQRRTFECAECGHSWEVGFGIGRPGACPECGSQNVHRSDADRGQGRGGRGRGMGCRRGQRQSEAAGKETT
ncbi:MAG TPA: DUF134 domain-containing protein [candidate division Zixibacteria bacterium]|nr:DUF134 domain-containing protein [candidate division Zixibacteria bacterium]